jgi:tRNA uridine 5-carboxymethylaminomethyl modification enzyme
LERKLEAIEAARTWCENAPIRPNAETVSRFEAAGISTPKKPLTASELLRRPEVNWAVLSQLVDGVPELDSATVEQVETDIKYAGYLVRETQRAARTRKMSAVLIPADMDFDAPGISNEVAERLRAARPQTLGAASRLPGITPAAIDMLAVLLARRQAG